MDINPNEIAYKKQVGELDGSPILEMGLKGGLSLIIHNKGRGNFTVISAGPHRSVSRHLAKKKTDDKIEWTDLSKADWVEVEHFSDLLPYYEALTDALALRSQQGS